MKSTGSNSLHVLFVVSSLRRGGAERVISILANQWAANGRIVTIVTLNHGPGDTGYELHQMFVTTAFKDGSAPRQS